MKLSVLTSVLFAFLFQALQASAQNSRFKFDFSLIFGGCFRNDMVTVKINDVVFANNILLESNIVGSANFSITQDKNGILVKSSSGAINKLMRFDKNRPVKILVSVNGTAASSTFNLRKGKIFYIGYCWDENRVQKVTINQQNHPVYFI